MTNETSIKHAESTAVQLTRMEGVINLIKVQGDDVVKRVGHLEAITAKVQAEVQKLQLEAVARDATAIALATALKEADTKYKDTSLGKWTPLTRVSLIVGVLYMMATLYFVIQK